MSLVLIDVIVAVGVLHSGNLAGTVLDFEIGFEDFDVDEFALHGVGTLGACEIKSKVAVVSEDETVQFLQHSDSPRFQSHGSEKKEI
jgi:hypothetical protein